MLKSFFDTLIAFHIGLYRRAGLAPSETNAAQMAIAIPADQLVVNTENLNVTANANAKFNISSPTYSVTINAGANTTITLTAATAKTKEATPTATFDTQGSDDGNLHGISQGIMYSVDGGIIWTENTSSYNYKAIYHVSADKDIKVYMPASDSLEVEIASYVTLLQSAKLLLV